MQLDMNPRADHRATLQATALLRAPRYSQPPGTLGQMLASKSEILATAVCTGADPNHDPAPELPPLFIPNAREGSDVSPA